MTPIEREAVRAQALEVLRSAREVLAERLHMSLDALIEREARRVEPRAEIAVFVVVAQVLVECGYDWMDVFEPASRFDSSTSVPFRYILDAVEAILRKA